MWPFRKQSGPPSAAAAVSRAVILKCQLVTALAVPPPDVLTGWMESWDADERHDFLKEVQQRKAQSEAALRDDGLWPQMTSSEKAFIRALPTEISPQAFVDVSWLMESAEYLLWALGYVDDLPPYDTQSNVDDLKRLTPSPIRNLLQDARLRSRDSISRARDVAEFWHWRSRTRQIQEWPQDRGARRSHLPEIIQMAAEKAASDGLFESPMGGDFPVFGRPYREISAEEWSQATSIAMERHRALNWLCGYAPGNRWDETPTDT